jgi:hypothetical protein
MNRASFAIESPRITAKVNHMPAAAQNHQFLHTLYRWHDGRVAATHSNTRPAQA